MLQVQCAAQSGHGLGKSQDRLLTPGYILTEGSWNAKLPATGIFAVMDGVGGIPGGELASSYCACQMMNVDIQSILTDEGIHAVQYLHEQMTRISDTLNSSGRMATTCSGVLLIDKNRYILFHTGNTRVWGLYGRYLRQLTEDHTEVADRQKNGEMLTQDEIDRIGHVINSCLGGRINEYAQRIEVSWQSCGRMSALLFTCDGIHEYVPVNILEEAAQGKRMLKEVIEIARQNGSADDCSIMLLHLPDKSTCEAIQEIQTDEYRSEARIEQLPNLHVDESVDSTCEQLEKPYSFLKNLFGR